MTLDQIDFFMSCAACLNFSMAAKYHFVSVSTLSRSISSLEDELGIKLFNRGYHGHSLTENGKDFFYYCVNSVTHLNRFVSSRTTMFRDKLIVGCYPHDNSFKNLIKAYSNALSDHHTENIKINFIPLGQMEDQLDTEVVDVALLEKNEIPSVDTYNSVLFCRDGEKEFYLLELKDKNYENLMKLAQLCKYFK